MAGTDEEETAISPLAPVSVGLRAEPAPGERVGRYVIERMLGRGGMGIVVSARDDRSGGLVAIKLLHPKAAKDAVQRERFVREARSLDRIKSDYVVRVLDAGVEERTGAPFIVMEHLDGVDLGQLLTSHGPLSVEMAVDCIVQICEAVAAAHAVGVIHRDLKPSNFFLTKRADGAALVKVLDFGISKAVAEDGLPDPRLTETQAVFGSPTYMSPEQIRSSKNVDERSDVWSIGVALFELLTGKLPFAADNVAGLLAAVVADPPFRLTRFAPSVPLDLEAIVHACLEKDPSRRVASATELGTRLAPFASPLGRAQLVRQPSGSVLPPRPSLPVPPLAFGTTGTDLSASAPSRFIPASGTARGIAIAVASLLVVGVLIGITALVITLRAGPTRAPDAAAAASASEPSSSAFLAPAPETAASIATAPSAVASSAPSPTSKHLRSPRGARSAAAGAGSPPPRAAPTTTADLDSRF